MPLPGPGRELQIQRMVGSPPVATVIAGIKTKTVTIASEPIDITNDDDLGFRTLLSQPGNNTLDLSFSGVTKDEALLAIIGAGAGGLQNIKIVTPSGAEIDGSFYLNNMVLGGEQDGDYTFEGEMQSSGSWTFTPGS